MSPYEEMQQLGERIQPWITFIADYEGSELGEQFRALEQAAEASSSAGDYEGAMKIYHMVEGVIEAMMAHGGWQEMINDFDDDFEYETKRQIVDLQSRLKHLQESPPPKPSEVAANLPLLSKSTS